MSHAPVDLDDFNVFLGWQGLLPDWLFAERDSNGTAWAQHEHSMSTMRKMHGDLLRRRDNDAVSFRLEYKTVVWVILPVGRLLINNSPPRYGW